MPIETLNASVIQQRLYSKLRESRNLAREPDDFLARTLKGGEYPKEALIHATDAVYKVIYYSCSADLEVDLTEQRKIEEVRRLLMIDDDRATSLNYHVGLTIYAKQFREAVSDGDISDAEYSDLEQTSGFFDLRKRDINRMIREHALAYYSFALTESLEDGVLSVEEMAKLESISRHFGLTAKHLSGVSVPQKMEVLRAALASIKSKGEIDDEDREHVRSLTHYLGANDLLKPCLMDLDLYERIFEIRAGTLPQMEADTLLFDSGEKLHFRAPCVFERPDGGKLRRSNGVVYLGTFKLRFVGRGKSHEIRYKNIFEVAFKTSRKPKVTLRVSSGGGSGNYGLSKASDPGETVVFQEMLTFLVRKARRLAEPRTKGSSYIPSNIRSEVWYRDSGKCVLCSAIEYLEFDHIIPRSKGGAASVANLQLLCRGCNSAKSDSI